MGAEWLLRRRTHLEPETVGRPLGAAIASGLRDRRRTRCRMVNGRRGLMSMLVAPNVKT
jgi:hypothetical protein